MDAGEFIDFAAKVVGSGKPGARSAVSRAYYGVFHIARRIVEDVTADTYGNARFHNLIPQFIASAGHPDGNAASSLLADLHAERLKADYDLDNASVETRPFAMMQVANADEARRRLVSFQSACDSDATVRDALNFGVQRVRERYKR